MDPILEAILQEAAAEYDRAAEKFTAFCSAREGFDILDEEVQELKQAIRYGSRGQARVEAIQVLIMLNST